MDSMIVILSVVLNIGTLIILDSIFDLIKWKDLTETSSLKNALTPIAFHADNIESFDVALR